MKKVTNTTHGMLMANRKNKDTVTLQFVKKDGSWSVPVEYGRLYGETDQQVADRLTQLNNKQFRVVEVQK